MTATSHASTNSVLKELDVVLENERNALRRLDSQAVENFSHQKAALEESLREAMERDQAHADPELLKRVHQKTQDNQVLLVHARNCVRTALEAATGGQQASYDTNRPPPQKAVRFDLKG